MQNNHLPTKDQLWKKYPELSRLWSEYIRLCRLPAPVPDVVRAFEDYRITFYERQNRYRILPEESGTVEYATKIGASLIGSEAI